MAKCEVLKPFIRSWEGGFSCHKNDRGGATKWGVTIGTFMMVYGKRMTVEDLKKMSEEQWMHIFKTYFWNKWRADEIESQAVANILVDWIWLSGPKTIQYVQKILGVAVDGVVGPKTIAAVNSFGAKKLFEAVKIMRRAYINSISKGSQKVFQGGWTRRLEAINYDRLVCNDGKVLKWS